MMVALLPWGPSCVLFVACTLLTAVATTLYYTAASGVRVRSCPWSGRRGRPSRWGSRCGASMISSWRSGASS